MSGEVVGLGLGEPGRDGRAGARGRGGVEISQAGIGRGPGRDPPDTQGPQVLVGQPAHHQLFQEPPAGVVRTGAASGRRHDAGRGVGAEAQDRRTEGDLGIAAQGTLSAAHGPAHDDGHAGLTLQAGHAGLVLGFDLHPVDEPSDRRQGDTALAERRQHMLDVAQEQRVGPDDEDALALQGEPVRIEKVCGPVQRHRRLAGAGSTLDDHDAQEGGPDDLVLLPLDGGDDVAHDAGPGPFQSGQERSGPAQLELAVSPVVRGLVVPARAPVLGGEPGVAVTVGAGGGAVHDRGRRETLVLHAHDPSTLGGEVATKDETHGLSPRGPVEGLGHGRPPVHHQGLEVLARDPQAADVETLGVLEAGRRGVVLASVDAAEAQGLLADVELVEAGQAGADDDVALLAELVRPPRPWSITDRMSSSVSDRNWSRRS